jgi:hypothetical protein
MMRSITKARMTVVGLIVVLACSELLGQRQSSLERARELVSCHPIVPRKERQMSAMPIMSVRHYLGLANVLSKYDLSFHIS